MQLQLHINYYTTPNETICVEINTQENTQTYQMQQSSEGRWTFELTVPESCKRLTYCYYVLSTHNTIIRREWNQIRSVDCSICNTQIFEDAWTNIPNDLPFYSSAFTKGFYKREKKNSQKAIERGYLRFEIAAPTLTPELDLVITGEGKLLGNWDNYQALTLDDCKAPIYTINLPLSQLHKGQNYKFAARNRDTKQIVAWDKGDNRIINLETTNQETIITIRDLKFEPQLPNFRCAGVAIPVFSLRSEKSWGIGEYSDLKPMIDWAKQTEQKIIQILPINDTTLSHQWTDSYPYNSNSIFALHPIYLNPDKIGTIADQNKHNEFQRQKATLNSLEKIDYQAVDHLKWSYFKELFDQQKDTYQQDSQFKQWYQENREWLIPYSAFSHLRDRYAEPNFALWREYAQYDANKIAQLVEKDGRINRECGLYIYLQFQAHLQLKEITLYAHQQGIILKGDIPIGISRNSVEAWVEPHLFNLNGQAGAPPDDFSKNGQNWGFPTYCWEEMAKDNYEWWKKRFRKMAQYFDAYRIDHLLGFFRIWEIPMTSTEGLLGHFNPALPLSIQEIESYGIPFVHTQMVNPSLTSKQIERLFGENTPFALKHLFDSDDTKYKLKPQYSTQKSIENTQFTIQSNTNTSIKRALFKTINDVLFVEDPMLNEKYHPRIAAQETCAFENLDETSKQAFSRLHDDFFFVRHNDFWKQIATKRLSELISSTKMLVCAEDLGMIPACVPEVMDQFKMLSLEIQRMPKSFGKRFDNTLNYPYLSVAATSTHDMSPIRLWWEEDRNATSFFYNNILNKEGEAPSVCTPEIAIEIIKLHLDSPAMFTILPLQDWLATDDDTRQTDCMEERINVPSNPKHYWRYRMHLTIEQLLQASSLNQKISTMIISSGREK